MEEEGTLGVRMKSINPKKTVKGEGIFLSFH